MAIASVKLPSKKFYLIGDILFVIAKNVAVSFVCEKDLVLQFLL